VRKKLCAEGHCLAVFMIDGVRSVDVYIHDLLTDSTVWAKRIVKSNTSSSRGFAHMVADVMVKGLTGKEGFFSTRIAYCKVLPVKKKSSRITAKKIIIADIDGSHPEVVVSCPGIYFGLRWNEMQASTTQAPLLFYSQHTPTNIRLMTVNRRRQSVVASDSDGITMSPVCMPDGSGLLYCATDDNGYAQLYHYSMQGVEQITYYEGNSITPSLSPDGTMLYFCSDYLTGAPQLFAYEFKTQALTSLTNGGYCTTPVVSRQGDRIVYTKMVQGGMQLFVYDIAAKIHTQVTHDKGDKESPSWSPCGTFLLYGEKSGSQERIVLLNMISGKKKYITSAHERCSCPVWSLPWQIFPVIER
jgi:TolB protein